ncbi:hypothetical protein [Butyrivibrio proteoclasticus]|uniref:hypothetical protein n=1 Tax=Butyrivibrio proteoclasticus TaxID=43305 RepID=UPI0006883667|nr:hypothetical protein [Butyrivibrio proteoclasticus]
MTQEMGRQITSLRLKGLGYKSIAIVVGTSRENVRYFCKTHGLDGTADMVKIKFEEHKNTPDNCKYCGKRLERKPHSGKKLFCSDECRRLWWKKHPEEANHGDAATYECRCAYCKRVFYSYGKKGRKYCSHDCYIQDRFWTDPNETVSAEEIAIRQRIAESEPAQMQLRRIS